MVGVYRWEGPLEQGARLHRVIVHMEVAAVVGRREEADWQGVAVQWEEVAAREVVVGHIALGAVHLAAAHKVVDWDRHT